MALFGDKKKEVKTKKEQTSRVHHVHAKRLTDGVANEIIRAPWFSEKALIMTEKGVYTFVVPKRTTKAEIAGALKEIFKVEPRKINIVNLPGKKKAMRKRRGVGTRAARHKAYVYLNTGDTIQFT